MGPVDSLENQVPTSRRLHGFITSVTSTFIRVAAAIVIERFIDRKRCGNSWSKSPESSWAMRGLRPFSCCPPKSGPDGGEMWHSGVSQYCTSRKLGSSIPTRQFTDIPIAHIGTPKACIRQKWLLIGTLFAIVLAAVYTLIAGSVLLLFVHSSTSKILYHRLCSHGLPYHPPTAPLAGCSPHSLLG
jgi:hypothetical protein